MLLSRRTTPLLAESSDLTLGSTAITGNGSDMETALSHALPLESNGRYEVSLQISARTTGGALICAVQITGALLAYNSGTHSWASVVAGRVTRTLGGSPGTYFTKAGEFYTVEELPGLGTTGTNLTVASPAIDGQAYKLEARGTITYRGTTL